MIEHHRNMKNDHISRNVEKKREPLLQENKEEPLERVNMKKGKQRDINKNRLKVQMCVCEKITYHTEMQKYE